MIPAISGTHPINSITNPKTGIGFSLDEWFNHTPDKDKNAAITAEFEKANLSHEIWTSQLRKLTADIIRKPSSL